jgi:hypothetical protein
MATLRQVIARVAAQPAAGATAENAVREPEQPAA